MSAHSRLLLVDSSSHSLADLQRTLSTREKWQVQRVATPDAALDVIAQRGADVVLHGCGVDDAATVCASYGRIALGAPAAVRYAVVPPGSANVAACQLGAHQVLALEVEQAVLLSLLDGACRLSRRLSAHPELVVLLNSLPELPSPPALYFEIREVLETANGEIGDVATVVGRDPAITARVLKTANSGMFARPRSIDDLENAVALLGTDLMLGLALSAHLYDRITPLGFDIDRLWQHSMRVSAIARQVARDESGEQHAIAASAMAGLLHDIGRLVFLANRPDEYLQMVRQTGDDEHALQAREEAAFGFSHAEIGAVVLELWHLPASIVEAVRTHHARLLEPGQRSQVAIAVLVAEVLAGQGASAGSQMLPPEALRLSASHLESWCDMAARSTLAVAGL